MILGCSGTGYTVPEPYVDEMVRSVFDQLACRQRRYVGDLWITNALYLLKKQLPHDSPVGDCLAFYWYRHGPVSEAIADALDNKERITRNSDGSYSYSEKYRKTKVMDHDEHVREALGRLTRIVGNLGPDGYKKAYHDAPYEWYETYGDFKEMLCAYYQHVFEKRSDASPYTRSDILEALDETLGTNSLEERFTRFRLAYNGFVRMIISILKIPDIENYKDEFYRLCQLSEDIWTVFAKGVRARYHDRYYDEQVKEWEADYQNAVSGLALNIDQAEETLEIPVIEDDTPDEELETIDIDMAAVRAYTPGEMVRKIDEIVDS